MHNARAQSLAYQQRLLTDLGNGLRPRGIAAVLMAAEDGSPGLSVKDRRSRIRKIYVNVPFYWFYWGDQPDERTSCLNLETAVERIEQAARAGWRAGEQAELRIDLGMIADAYRRA
ncbi:hypothetical protein ACIHFD_43695 [Nonomuraea sp. NPDC051941]|uniref:hypothetical protein n=1 Tax=Nonomuraea sp. NPDC051941 TaxID=3364373 RepID=UPI0037CB4CE5